MTVEELKKALEELIAKIDEATTEEEVDELAERAKEIKEEIRNKETEAKEAKEAEVRTAKFNPSEARKQVKGASMNREAREAFREYMMTRADATTVLTDVVVPTEITGYVVKDDPEIETIIKQASHTAYPAGVDVPVFDICGSKAVWASENGSFESKKATDSKVSFKAYKVGNVYSMSKEVQIMSLPEFEQNVAKKVVADTLRAEEEGIFAGTGTGQMTGITATTSVPSLDFDTTYKGILKVLAKLPTQYAGKGAFYMSQSTFYDLLGITDTAGQPVARTGAGLDGKIQNILFGKPVYFTQYLPDLETATAGKAVVVYGDMSKYGINTIWANKCSTHDDFRTDRHEVKGVSIIDGKVLIPEAFVVAKKKADK